MSRRCATHNPLITTLDVNMPGMDGFAVARRLREFSSTYLIMITALADEIDVVQGFEAGADDYLVKPFRPRELRARADSMLRRPRTRVESPSGWAGADPAPAPAAPPEESWAAAAARDLGAVRRSGRCRSPRPRNRPPPPPSPCRPHRQEAPQPPAPARPSRTCRRSPSSPRATSRRSAPAARTAAGPVRAGAAGGARGARRPADQDGWVRFNGLALSDETRVVTVNGAPVELTRTEFDLLASLLSTGRRVRSKADLVLTMRGQQYVTSYFVNEADKRSVEVHIANLRRKIGDDSGNPRYIETVRGVGYRLAEPL